MTATFESVLQSALMLSLEDRSRIATRLIDSVDSADDAGLSPAWRDEIDRRMKPIREGTSRRTPHAEVMAEARQLIAQM